MDLIPLLFSKADESWTLLRFSLFNRRKSKEEPPTSGWDRASMRRCWYFLDMTGRSIAPFINEFDGELAQVICIFYLVLRALDTIEDDMTLPSEVKQSLLRSFHIHTVTPGWNFEGSGPNERDRQLLVEYHTVVEELNLLPPKYKSIIIDITQNVEVGMADHARIAYEGRGSILLTTIANYNRYCRYVGGIPGEGFFRIISVFADGEERPCTGPQLEISNSAALFIQKLDIIRDYREDIDENRYLWPEEIWSRKEYGFNTMREMHEVVEADVDSERVEKAMYVQSEMVSDALLHATDMLDFLRMIKHPVVFDVFARLLCFNFAKLEMSFMNRKVFLGNVKLRKAESAWIMMRAKTLRQSAIIFCKYARKLQAKVHTSDPNFFQISVACEKIEQWYEYHFASQGQDDRLAVGDAEVRTPIPHIETERDLELARRKRLVTSKNDVAAAYTKIGLSSTATYPIVLLLLLSLLFLRSLGAGYRPKDILGVRARNKSVEGTEL